MWVYTNGEFVKDGRQIRIYEYHPGRNGGFAGKFLEGYEGILQTDGYAGYEQIPCKEHALCWGHAHRYFVDAIPAGISQEDAAESVSGQAIRKINELFALDKELSYKSAEERRQSVCCLKKTSWRLSSCGWKESSLSCFLNLHWVRL